MNTPPASCLRFLQHFSTPEGMSLAALEAPDGSDTSDRGEAQPPWPSRGSDTEEEATDLISVLWETYTVDEGAMGESA